MFFATLRGNVTLASAQKPLNRLHCPFPRDGDSLGSLSVSPHPFLSALHHRPSVPTLPTLSPFNSIVPRENHLQVVSQQVGENRTPRCLELRWASGRQVARKVLTKEVSQVAKLPLGWMDECAHRRKEGKKGQRGERGRHSKNTAIYTILASFPGNLWKQSSAGLRV